MARGASLTLRLDPELKARLSDEAEAKGRSVSSEVERRLLRSFDEDDRQGGEAYAALVRMAVNAVHMIEGAREQKITDSPEAYFAARAAIARIVADRLPRPAFDAHKALKQAEDELERLGPDKGQFQNENALMSILAGHDPNDASARLDRMLEHVRGGGEVDQTQARIIYLKAVVSNFRARLVAELDQHKTVGEIFAVQAEAADEGVETSADLSGWKESLLASGEDMRLLLSEGPPSPQQED